MRITLLFVSMFAFSGAAMAQEFSQDEDVLVLENLQPIVLEPVYDNDGVMIQLIPQEELVLFGERMAVHTVTLACRDFAGELICEYLLEDWHILSSEGEIKNIYCFSTDMHTQCVLSEDIHDGI